MKSKIVNLPRIIDLGCNRKAKVVEINGDRFLLSYETYIAVVTADGTLYRINDITTNTTWRHWYAFVDYIGLDTGKYRGADVFRALPLAKAS